MSRSCGPRRAQAGRSRTWRECALPCGCSHIIFSPVRFRQIAQMRRYARLLRSCDRYANILCRLHLGKDPIGGLINFWVAQKWRIAFVAPYAAGSTNLKRATPLSACRRARLLRICPMTGYALSAAPQRPNSVPSGQNSEPRTAILAIAYRKGSQK